MDGMERAQSSRSSRSAGGDFFFCFTARDPAAQPLSTSLSRRLRISGSLKGAQSPMFPAGERGGGAGRRKGSAAFEAAEPSSPKVTCIGQVRVKSRKKKGPPVALASSRSQRGDGGSFRRAAEKGKTRRSQRWMYQLPISICEALRALGSELRCFLPCCSSPRTARSRGKRSSSSCAAVLGRWLVAVEDEGERKGNGNVMGMVVEERERSEVGFNFIAREELGFAVEEEEDDVGFQGIEAEKPEAAAAAAMDRICIPPRNALLLMRCRSDPVRVAALADRFFGSAVPGAADDSVIPPKFAIAGDNPIPTEDHMEDAQKAEELDVPVEQVAEEDEFEELADSNKLALLDQQSTDSKKSALHEQQSGSATKGEETQLQDEAAVTEDAPHLVQKEAAEEGEMESRRRRSCSSSERRSVSSGGASKHKEWGRRRSCSYREKEKRRPSFSSEKEARRHSFSTERDVKRGSLSADREGRRKWSFSLSKEDLKEKPVVAATTTPVVTEIEVEEAPITMVDGSELAKEVAAVEPVVERAGRRATPPRRRELPECLLMMMYEPKLSMEVSKETWVCSNDFHRWRPHHPQPATTTAAAEPPPPPPPPQTVAAAAAPPPPPAAAAAAAAYGPVVLTRCKSEPMRSSDRVAPGAWFWKSRHEPIGAEGIGF